MQDQTPQRSSHLPGRKAAMEFTVGEQRILKAYLRRGRGRLLWWIGAWVVLGTFPLLVNGAVTKLWWPYFCVFGLTFVLCCGFDVGRNLSASILKAYVGALGSSPTPTPEEFEARLSSQQRRALRACLAARARPPRFWTALLFAMLVLGPFALLLMLAPDGRSLLDADALLSCAAASGVLLMAGASFLRDETAAARLIRKHDAALRQKAAARGPGEGL